MPIISEVRRLKQSCHHKSEAIVIYIVSSRPVRAA